MARRKTKKNSLFKKFIQDVESAEQRDVEQTPLLALIVATFLDRLGFVQFINSVVTWDEKQWQVSPGNLAKALIITPFLCIGARIPLYSIHENYQSVDMSLLFEDHVEPEWLTRDAFACLLDRIYEAGCENIFTQIALKVYDTFKILFDAVFHGDTSTFVLYGAYADSEPDNGEEAVPAYGHSKDGKPNLKQVVLGMVTDKLGIPLLVTVRSGNQNDSKWNKAIIDSLSDLLKTATSKVTYIADSKLTTAALRSLYDNLVTGENQALAELAPYGDQRAENPRAEMAIALDTAIRETKKAGWRGNKFKEREVLGAIRQVLGDHEPLIGRIFEIVKNQRDY